MKIFTKVFIGVFFALFLVKQGSAQTLYDSFADGNFSGSPSWSGNTGNWSVVANSDAAAGATGSNTIRLASTGGTTVYLSSQIATWGTGQEWGFWVGRRAQAFTGANQMYIWLYANEATLTSGTVDGYRLAIGDDSGGDNIRLEYIVNGALSSTVINSSGTLNNGLTDIGFLIRVTRSSSGAWEIFTSTLPTSNGTGAIATALPNSTNANVSQGTATHNTLVPAANGYIGVGALHSSGGNAIAAVEFDQVYFTPAGATVTIDDTGTPAVGNINAGATDVVISAFNLTPSGGSVDFTAIDIETSGTATTSDLSNFRIFYDADGNSAINGGESSVSGTGIALANPLSFTITGQTGFSAARRYLVVADVAGGATNGNTITASVAASTDVTTTGTESGTATGNQQTILVSGTPVLAAGAVSAGFGNVCINTLAGSTPTLDITGSDLTSAGLSVSADPVYTFATTSGGTYSNPLNITQGGCSGSNCYSQTIYVHFTPTAVQSYNGDITVSGGGASDATTAVTGSGVNTMPTVTTGSASSVTTSVADAVGTINTTGCSAVTAYGIEYSTTNGFANGTGTQAASSNLTGGNFSSSLSGLTANTTYYFKAYATSGGGTGYGSQASFITYPDAPTGLSAGSVTTSGFTVSWTEVSGTIENYEVEVHSNSGYTALVGTAYGTANNASSQVVSGLSSSTPYWYRVRSRNNSDTQTSAWVNGAGSVTTSAGPLWENPISGTNPNTANPYTTGQTLGSAFITVSGIGRGSGIAGTNANDRYNATSWNTSALDVNDYFYFTITPTAGYEIDFTNFVYTSQASGSGPTNVAFRSSLDTYGTNIGTAAVSGATISLSGASYQDISSAITFRFYAWGGSGGTFSINDFTFNGTVAAVACNAPASNAANLSNSTPAAATSIGLTWDAVTGADGYVVAIRTTDNDFSALTFSDGPLPTAGSAPWTDDEVTNVVATNSATINTGLTSSTSYYFKVYAYEDCSGTYKFNNNNATGNPATITTAAAAPEIIVTRTSNSANVADGSTFDFGSVNVGSNLDIQFTIENHSAASANLTFPATFTGGGAFSIQSQPGSNNLAPGATTTFTVRFTPAGSGLTNYAFSFTNDDTDENPYNITFEGTAVPACVAPNAVTNITLTPFSGSVSGTIDAPSGGADGYLVIRNGTGTLGTAPTTGTSYTAGNAFGTGTVVAFGSSASFTATGLNPNTTYHFFAFPYNNVSCFGGPVYNTTEYGESATTLDLSYQLFDDFNRTPTANTVGEPSSLPGTDWAEVESGASSVRVSTNALLLDRDGNGGSNGLEYAYFDMTGKYPTIFSSATSTLEWFFNIRQTRPDPSGYNSGNYGAAFILGATSNDPTTGNGYAVIVGNNNGAPFTGDEGVHLIRYTGGLNANSSITPIISWYTGDAFTGTLDYDNELSVKVEYNPTNNEWNLYVRDDGTFGGGFADPTTIDLVTDLRGTATNNTYTASNLNYLIPYWHRASGSGEYAMFDNINIPLAAASNPEIQVAYTSNAVEISDGGSVDFGPVKVTGASYTMTYTVTNIGTSNLTLGAISITGANAGDFSYTSPVVTTLAANASTTFTITFDPSATGSATATFSMVTNDTDENPFNFTLNGEGATPPVINEFLSDLTGSDTNEFIEVFGANATAYTNMTLVVLEGDATNKGVIDNVISVGTTNATGYWWTGYQNSQIENGTITIMLVMNFTGSAGQDLDTNDDGTLDVTPWTRVVDDVALRASGADKVYSTTIIAPNFDGTFLMPGGASRIANGADTDNIADWMRNDVDGWGLTGFSGSAHANEAKNTPNRINTRFNVWLGTNTTWNDASNWTVRIPNDTTEALIPTVGSTNYPVISGIVTFDVYGIYFTSTQATITINAGAELRNFYNFQSNSGSSTFGDGTLSFLGAEATTISGTFSIGELAINNANGVTIQSGTTVNITDRLSLEAGQLTNSGALVLKSTATKTAFVDDFSDVTPGTYSGNITIERYIPAGTVNEFHYIGSASGGSVTRWTDDFSNTATTGTDGTKVTPLPTCDPLNLAFGSAYGNLFSYDESLVSTCYQDGWRVRTVAATAARGTGFAAVIPSGVVLDETGAYTNTAVNINGLSVTGSNLVGHSKGYHLVANPFFAPIDWNQMATANAGNNLDATAYIYNPNSGTYGTYNLITSGQITTNMAFFVRHDPSCTGCTSFDVDFVPSTRTTIGNNNFLRQGQPYAYGLKIKADNGTSSDETLIAFDAAFTDQYENGYDANKLLSRHGVPSLYTRAIDNSRKAIEAVGVNTTVKTIPLGLKPGATGNYSLKFDGIQDFPATVLIWLEDLQTGTVQYLRQNDTYTFTSNMNDDPERFLIHFSPEVLFNTKAATCAGADGEIALHFPPGIDWSFTIEDAQGLLVTRQSGITGLAVTDDLAAGNYTALLTHSSGYQTSEVITLAGAAQVTADFTPSLTSTPVNTPVVFTELVTGANSVEWDFGDGTVVSGVSNPAHAYSAEGLYTVTLRAMNDDCEAVMTKEVQVYKLSVGIGNVNENELNVFVADGNIYITFDFSAVENAEVRVMNMIGQEIFAGEIRTEGVQHLQLDENVNGQYLAISIRTASQNLVKKVFVHSAE